MRKRIVILQDPVVHVFESSSRKWQMCLQQFSITLTSHIPVEHYQLGPARQCDSRPHVDGRSLLLIRLYVLLQHLLARDTPNANAAIIAEQAKSTLIREDDPAPILQSPWKCGAKEVAEATF